MAKRAAAQSPGVQVGPGSVSAIDLSSVEGPSFEVMPRGNYQCVVTECDFDFSSTKGEPMWKMRLEVMEGEFEGRRLFSNMMWAGNGLTFTKRDLEAIRPDLAGAAIQPDDDVLLDSMVGLRVTAKVATQRYEGETRNNVRQLLAPVEGDGAFV